MFLVGYVELRDKGTVLFLDNFYLTNIQSLQILSLFQAMYKSNRGTVSGYFLAGRFITWLPVS